MFSRRKLAALLVLALASLAIPFVPLPAGYTERLGTIRSYEEQNETSALSRLHFWEVAVEIAVDNPLGVGLFNFEQVYDRYDFLRGEFGRRRSVHSSHFQVLSELGWDGLLTWMFLFTMAFWTAFRIRSRARSSRLSPEDQRLFLSIANGIIASMAAFLVGGAFIALALNDLTWLTFSLLASADILSRQLCQEAEQETTVPVGDRSRSEYVAAVS